MKLGIQTVNKNRYLLMGFIVPLFLFGAIYASVTYSVDFLGGDVVTGAVLSRGSPIEDSGEVISFEPLPDPGGVPTIASIPAFSGFVQNCGQVADGNVSYYLQGKDQWIGFETGSIRFVTWGDNGTGMEALRLDFPNSNPVEPRGTRRMPHSTNYFISHEQYTDITSYAELNYDNIYPGIDLRFFHCAQGLKYEFIAAAGVDTSIIGLRFSPNAIVDAQPTRLVATSNRTGAVLYEEAGLNVYQTDGKSVGAAFDADDQLPGVVRFNLAPHAEDQGVVIDPIVLTFSTYVGGGAGDYGQSVAVDLSGFVYVAGYTTSVNFPTQNPYMTDPGDGTSDVFVMKMDPATPSLVYSTYLGGSSNDEAKAIAIDSAGNAYICGQSNSVNYPLSLLHHIQTYQVGYDVIVTKLNATGNGLVYSTYLGGTGNDMGYSIAVDQEAYAYVTGVTGSTSFPTQNPYMTDPGDGTDDGFVAKIDPSGDSLVYSTYLGGDGLDRLFDICVSPAGHAYVTGYTLSTNYPRLNELCLPAAGQEAVVTKLGPGGDTLEYSTYLGGASTDIAFAIAVDEAGSACITGRTESGDFPLSSPYQATSGGISDAFITKISAAGNTFVFSTYYGGNGYDVGRDVAFFPGGDVCVGIYGLSSNLPVVHQFQGDQAELDAYVVRLTGSGDRVVFATYLGGSSYEDYINLAIKDNDTVVVTGTTASTDFPLVNPYQGDQLETDVFVSALLFDLVPPSISLVSPSNGTTGRSIDMIHVTAADAHLATFRYTWVGVTGWLSIAADASISFCPVEGSHVLSLFANDTSGNSESMNFTFVTDDSGPAWNTAILPANNTWHTSNPVLALEFSDAAGMNNGWWDVDDATPDNILFSGASGTTWSHAGWYMDNLTWTTLSEGWHVLYFSAGDDLGNVGGAGGEWQWRFGKDTLVPASPTPASPTHPIGTWTDSNTIAVEWTVPGDSGGSGVVGYAISWSNNTPADPGTIVNTTMLTTDSPSLGSGMWYFNIRAIDGVGNFSAVASIGPFLIDVTPPSPVANLRSTSHTVDLWSNDRTIEVAWDEAVDSGGSGIAGYSFIWFPVPQTPPMSISTTITNHTSGELSDQASWFFNIIAIDFADNPSSLVSLGPFKIDGTPPTSPSPTSTTHVILNWSNSAVINMTWPVPSDMGGSGIAGYATSFSLGPSNPGTVITTTGTMTSSPSLASGNTWYFNIRSRDGAGSWSNVTNVGPFYIDANPPNTTISFVPTWPPYFVNVSTLFTLSGGDDPGGSGLDQREYSINGSEWAQGDSFTLFGWSNGTILIQYRSKDLVGNVEAFGTRVVRLDTLQPNTTISFVAEHSPDFVNASTPFTLGGADNTGGSGLLLREYRLDLGSWITYASPFNLSALTNGTITIDYRSQDNAGNVEAFGTRVVRLDTLPPNTTLSYTTAWAPNFVVSATVFTLGGSDNAGGSGLALRYYDINGTGWTAGDSFDLTSWSNGSITLRYYSIDNAGNVELAGLRVVLIDTIAPDAPAATSTTHIASTWSSVNVVTVNWSAPGDGNGSGIAGYACSWSRGTGDPGTTITHVGLTATSPMLADANDWHFNIRAIDGVGLASPSVSIGPFFVDVTPPDAPLVSSSTHTIGVPSMVNIINVSWVAPGDGSGSGIAGYSYSWTRGIQGVDNSSDTTALSVVSTELDPASDYYFNMRAIDVVGHGSVVAHLGPFWVTGSSLIPTAMGPADQTIVQNSGDVILSWTFFDPYGIGGHYRILLDGTPATNWSTWTTGVQVNFTIHATVLGIRNYTAEYNNTLGYSGRDTVIVKIVEPAPPFDLTLVMIVAGAAAVSVATIAVASSKKRSRAKKAKDKGHGEPAMKVPAKGKVAPTAAVPVVGKLPGKGAAAVADPYSVAPLTETDRAELEKTEKEVRTFETQHICVVHKGPIAGAIFLCPKCKVFYCMNCARVLKQKGEKCWSCGEDIAIDIPPTEAGESAGHGGVDAPPPKPVAGPDDKAKDAPDRGGPVDSPQP